MNLSISNLNSNARIALNWRRGHRGCSNATSALAGGCCRLVPRGGVLARTAQRDDVEETGTQRASHESVDATGAVAEEVTIPRNLEAHSSPISFNNRRRLPNLSCSSPDTTSCFNIRLINDPCQDDSLDLKVFQYMVELVRGGTTVERATEVISQWSGGGGVEQVDLHKLRGFFMRTTFGEVMRQHAVPAVMPFTLTCLSYWSLGLLPGTDEAVLPPAVRGALVAANLLMLVYFASGSLKSAGRVVRVGRAALKFSNQAELVLLAMRDLAAGHGVLIQATLGPSNPTLGAGGRSPGGSGASSAAAGPREPSPPPGVAAAAVAARRHASRQLVLQASTEAMRHAKRHAATSAASAPLSPAHAIVPEAVGPSIPVNVTEVEAVSSPSAASLPSRAQQQPLACPTTPAPSASSSSPLSSLDSYFVLREAAAVRDGFDAVSELGLAPEDAAAAAAMYARYGDSSRGGRIGDYELRRLLQEAGVPPLGEDERRLLLLLHSRDPPSAVTAAGRGRAKGWLTFAEWAAWWAATPSE